MARPILSGLSLVAFSSVLGLTPGTLRAAPERPLDRPIDVQPPEDPGRPGRVTFGLGFYENEIDESVDTLFPLAVPEHGLFFLNPKLSLSDRMNPSVSIGLGYRHIFEGPKIILGANLFYDSYVSPDDHHYNQFGAGVEVLSRWIDWRANYYLPEQNRRRNDAKKTMDFSSKSTESSQALGPQGGGDTLSFAGHNLIDTTVMNNRTLHTVSLSETETTRFWEQYEAGMRGFDTELGFLIPGLDRYAETRIFGGYYFFQNPFGKDISGFKGRVEIRALPAVTLDAAYYANKEIIGSNWYYGIRVSAPFDLANIAHHKNPFAGIGEAFKPKDTSEKEYFNNRLTENLIRTSRVSTVQSKYIQVAVKKDVYHGTTSYITGTTSTSSTILTLGGAPITLTHADSAAAAGGDGTAENPYSTLTLADADAVKRDIVYLHADSTFTAQSITLAANQQLLGDSKTGVNMIQTDQRGTIMLPHATAGIAQPLITNPGGAIVNVTSNNVVSNLHLDSAARGVYAAAGASGITVTNSTISNMTTTGIEIKPSTSSTISGVTFISNNQDVILNASNTTITNTTSTGAVNGSIQLLNTTGTTTLDNVTITGAGGFGLQVGNSGGTHNISGLSITGGAGLGVDIEGGAGTFNFDSASSITNTGQAGMLINGGTTVVNYGGNISQAMNAPAVTVLGGHTGSATFSGGTVAATGAQGLRFDNANGTYQFLGTTSLTGGANLQILNGSAGAFTFGTGASIVNGAGQGILVDNSTASLNYSGSVSASAGTLLQVNNHSAGTIQFDTGTLTATGGNGLQFNNADGTYKFLGTANLSGVTAGVSLVNGSDGIFAFDTATSITNPTGTAFFVNTGTANITYSGNITANTAFGLQVLNHSAGTIAFNTGSITQTAGSGVQFVNDSGTYSLADTRVSNSSGNGIQVDASPTGTFTFASVKLANNGANAIQLTNAGTVNVLGGTIDGPGGIGIFSLNTTLTATGLTLGGTTAIGSIGIQVQNTDGTARTVTISNDSIRSNGTGIQTNDGAHSDELTLVLDGNTIQTLTGGSKAMNITGGALNSTIVKSMNGGTVIGNGVGGGVLFNRVTFDASGTALAGTAVNAGNWNIGQGTAARALNDGLHFDGPTGDVEYGTLNIFNNAGTGLFVDTKTLGTTFTLGSTGGAIDTTGGTAMNIDPLTTHLTFTSVTSTNSGGAGVIVNGLTAGSTLTIGTTTVSGAASDGILVQNSAGATMNFGTTNITNVGGDGINLSQAGNANVTFGTTTINGFGAGNAGVDFQGSDVTATFGVTDIQNGGNGTGIDLSGSLNNRTITFATGSNIHGVAIGVELSGGGVSANSNFTFGDGTAANGKGSFINAPITVDATNLNPATGTYNFLDVNFTGTANFPAISGGPTFVSATAANGVGDGSLTNPYSVHDADLINTTAVNFVFLDGTYNFATLNGGVGFSLATGQNAAGFDNGNSITFGSAQQANILGDFGSLSTTVNRANTGNGTLSITNGAGSDVFDLLGSNQFVDLTLSGSGGATHIINVDGGAVGFANGGGITVSGTTIGNLGAGSTALNFVNATGSISATGNNIQAGTQTLVSVNGGTANYTIDQGTLPGGATPGTLSGASIVVQNTAGGSFETTGAVITTNGNTAVTLNGNAATTTFTGATVTRAAGDTAFSIDATAASTGKVTIDGSTTINNAAGLAFNIGSGARDIDASTVNITNNNSTGGVVLIAAQTGGSIKLGNITNDGSSTNGVISTTGQTGGTASFGNVAITGYTGGGTAVSLGGTAGTVSFVDLDVTTTSGAGVNVGAITFAPGSTPTINAAGGPALVMNGTTLSGGAATFASVTGTNPGAGNASISLTNVTGSTTFTTVNLSGTSATGIVLNNAGTVAVLGGTIIGPSGDGITSTNTALTATGLTIGATVQPFGNGITIVNNDGTARVVNLSNNTITAEADGIHTTDGGHAGELSLILDGDTITSLAGGTLGISVTGGAANSTTINSMNGGTIIGIGSSGGVLFNRVTFDAVTGGAIQQVTGGTWNIGQGTAANARVAFNGLEFEAATGDLAFNTLNIFNNTGTGLLVNTKTVGTTFSLGSTGGTINTANGAAMNLDPLTTHITLTSVSSVSSPTSGVIVDGLSAGSTLTIGSTTVNTSTGDGIVVRNSAGATLDFGTTNVISSGQDGIDLTQAGNASVTFGATTINGFGAANAGVNFAGSDVTATFGVTSIQNGGNGTGIDLSSTQNGRTITFAKGSSITNVNVGVQLSSSHTTGTTANANFTFGDGEGVVDKASTISATTTVDAIGLNPASGTYNFQDVNFTGAVGFQAAPSATFVSAAAADGAGNGTFTNPYSVHDADAITTAGITFAFLDGAYDMVTLNGAAAFSLSTNQIVAGLDNGNTFSFGLIQPANVLGNFGPLGGTVARGTPGSGSGGAISLTNGAGGVFVLGNGNTIMDVTVAGGGGTTSLFFGSGINGVSIHDTTLTNTGPGATFSFVNSTGTITLTNNKINTTGGRLLDVDGGTANLTLTAATNTGNGAGTVINNGGNGIRVVNTTGGSVTLTNLQVTNSATTTLTFDNNDATFAVTGSKFGAAAGITLLNVDATSASTTALVFDNTNSFTQTSGAIAIIGAGARDIDLSAQNFTNTGSAVANVISVTGQTGGTISFGNVGITGYNNAAGTAVSLQGTAGTVTFGDLDVATTAGTALNVGAITFNPGSSSTLSSNGAATLVMNGTTAQGGAIGFTGVTSSGGTTGLSLTNTVGSFTFTNIAISSKTGNGLTLSNAGTVNITGGTINGIGGNGIDATNTNLNVGTSQLQIGNLTAITGDGIHYNVTDAAAHNLSVFNADIRNVGGVGINVAHSGSGTVTVDVSSTGINSTGTALNVVKGNVGALNFSTSSDSLTSSGGLGMNVNGTAGAGILTVTQASDDVVLGAASGGIVFNGVVFDADLTTAGIQAVSSVGFDISGTNGAGLAISNATGTLAMDNLFISNNGGTGLIVLSAVNISSAHGAIATTNGAAMSLNNATLGLVFDTPGTAVSSTNSSTSGIIIGAGTSGSISLGGVSVTGATVAGLQWIGSAANVTASTITVQSSPIGLQFGTNAGTFEVTGNTSLTATTTGISATNATGIYKFDGTTAITAPTGISAVGATGSWTFTGNTTINFSGANRGLDLRNTQFALFKTGNITITGDGVTAGSIAVDLSGSKYSTGIQPVTTPANITLANGAGQTAAISAVGTGVLLGDTTNGSAGAYLLYGTQATPSSGSSIAVISGGTTIDTSHLTTVSPFQQGRYEFSGVSFTGQATFEQTNPNFIFVGSTAAGAANGTNPNNRISIATFLASDNNAAFLANKTIIFVNDGAAINFGASTLALGTNTVIEGFGNSASVTVPGGVQPANVIGTFSPGGGTFQDLVNGAATLTANNTTNVVTLSNGNTVQNININAGNNQIIGTGIAGFTLTGVNQTTAGASAISLTGATGTITMTGGSISGAAGTSFDVNGGSATISYTGSITNTAGRLVSIQNVTGGSVTLSGNLSSTSAGTGILVQNNTGGTFTFSGATKTLSTGTNQAVTLTNNNGATIAFNGGGLGITTTSGIGFGASGGGTIGLTGSGNTISTGTGTALNLNGVAITNGTGFILQSVSANGATNGIVLNSLTGGSFAGLLITGTGTTAGSGGTIQNTTGAAVVLTNLAGFSSAVSLANMNLTSDAGGITGTNFGTLAVANVSVTATGAVGALNLATGAFATSSTFSTLSSSGAATNGVLLNAVTGSFTAATGSITNATGASWSVVAGSVSTTYGGSITQGNNAALVSVSGSHSGTLTFNTGTLNATAGTGLQFDNADGTYNFNGTTTLNGGDAGVDILNGSGGTFSFGSGVAITSPSGTAFNVNGSSANVTYSGNITYATAGQAMVNITNETNGTITFQTGTLSATNGTGIVLNNADGTVNFNGTTTLNGGNAHVDINTGSGGNFSFGTGTTITSPTGTAFVFNGSTAGVIYSGNITQATAGQLMVDITNQASGTITFQTGTLSATNGTGINLNNVDGTVNFNGNTTLNGGNAHIDINTGSSGTITFGSGSSVGATTAPTGTAFREDTSTANVTYNGTLRQTNAANAVSITTKTGGTTAFGGAITAATTTANAINLTGNTGGTINFTGGLNLTTTSGTGFNATGGGTVKVSGAGNTITAGSGIGLNVVNTTIGAGSGGADTGLRFQKISSGAGANDGIVLDTTGASGSLTVTGTGTAGTGGTISGKTGADGSTTSGIGIYLNNTQNASFAWMQLNDFQNYAILGTNVTGFTLDHSVVNGTNGTLQGGIGEGDVYFTGLSGSATVSNSTFSGAAYDTFHVFNNGAQTLNRLTITNSSFAMTNTSGNDAIGLQATGGTFNVTVQSSTITSARSDLFQLNLLGTVTSDLVFGGATAALGNTLTNNNANIVSGGGGITIGGGGPANNITLTYNISHNSIKGAVGAALAVTKGTGTNASFTGTIDSNVIGTQGVAGSGSTQGIGINVFLDGAGLSTTTITNNHISGVVGGIYTLNHNGAGGQMSEIIQGNTIDTLDSTNGFAGIYVQTGSATGAGGDNNKSNVTLGGAGALKNSVDLGGNINSGLVAGIVLEQEGVSKVGLIGTPNYANTPYNFTAVETYVGGNNTVTGLGNGAVAVFAFGDPGTPAGGGYFGGAQFLMLAPGGGAASTSNSALTQSALNTLGNAAISVWQASTLSPAQISLLQNITFSVGDLPTGYVGEALPGQIILSSTAAGQSWFIDSTPLDNSEFTGTGTKLTAAAGSSAAGRVDAFTVVLHEVGHELGLDDTYLSGNSNSLMYGYITLGERRLPAANQALGVAAPTGNFADALQLRSSTLASPAASAWKPTVIIHQPITPSSTLPSNPRPADRLPLVLPEVINVGRIWFSIPPTDSTQILLQPVAESLSTTPEAETPSTDPEARPRATIRKEKKNDDQPHPVASRTSRKPLKPALWMGLAGKNVTMSGDPLPTKGRRP